MKDIMEFLAQHLFVPERENSKLQQMAQDGESLLEVKGVSPDGSLIVEEKL